MRHASRLTRRWARLGAFLPFLAPLCTLVPTSEAVCMAGGEEGGVRGCWPRAGSGHSRAGQAHLHDGRREYTVLDSAMGSRKPIHVIHVCFIVACTPQ